MMRPRLGGITVFGRNADNPTWKFPGSYPNIILHPAAECIGVYLIRADRLTCKPTAGCETCHLLPYLLIARLIEKYRLIETLMLRSNNSTSIIVCESGCDYSTQTFHIHVFFREIRDIIVKSWCTLIVWSV